MVRFYLETFGCAVNKADSAFIRGQLLRHGFFETGVSDADLLLVNTCGVKAPTEERVLERIRQLSEHGKPMVVAGCLPRISFDRVSKALPENSAVLDNNNVDRIIEAVERLLCGEKNLVFLGDSEKLCRLTLPTVFENPKVAVVPISQGCLGRCSYCGVKNARGALKSYSKERVLEKIWEMVSLGAVEIQLTAQDTGCWGMDSGSDLVELLDSVAALPSDFMVRVGMMNPSHANVFFDRLLDVLENKRFYRFIHLPVQSGSDRVLRDMGRDYSVDDFKRLVEKYRKRFPVSTVATDVIVGFPTETEEDFSQTLELLRQTRPEVLNASKYGARPGTSASKLPQLDSRVVKKRAKKLSVFWKNLAPERKPAGEVFVTGKSAEGFLARDASYNPVFLKKPSADKNNIF